MKSPTLPRTMSYSPTFDLKPLARRVSGGFKTCCTWLVAYRKAKAAEELYQRLARMSDVDLARVGMTRADISKEVRQRLEMDQ